MGEIDLARSAGAMLDDIVVGLVDGDGIAENVGDCAGGVVTVDDELELDRCWRKFEGREKLRTVPAGLASMPGFGRAFDWS